MIARETIADLMRWFDANQREMPWRGDRDPYRIWVSEVMLQQTQVVTVEAYYRRWMTRFPTLESLAAASLDEVLTLWQGLGYYSRARNLLKGASYILAHHQGQFPEERQAALKVPGVGPYIAGAVLSIAYDLPEPAIDGNVIRVVSRLMNWSENSNSSPFKSKVRKLLLKSYHNYSPRWLCQAWMELGALQCTPRPLCSMCPINSACKAREMETVLSLPTKKTAKTIPVHDGWIYCLEKDDAILLVQRPLNGLLAGMWELPNVMAHHQSAEAFCKENGIAPDTRKIGLVTHTYSHFKIKMSVMKATLLRPWDSQFWINARWIKKDQLDTLAKSAVTIKALKLINF